MKRVVLAALASVALSGTAMAQSEPLIGSILIFAGNFCPVGYAPTDGRSLPIAQNTALFSILGTTYGGDGMTTFALPNTKPIYTQNRATFTQCIALFGIFPARN